MRMRTTRDHGRALLSARKRAKAADCFMRIRNAGESVRDVFAMTGFADFLTLE